MPRNPNSPHDHGCGPIHTHISASENIKLQMMMSKLEENLRDEFIVKNELKTINSTSLLVEDNINDIIIKSIDRIEVSKNAETRVDTYTIYFNNNETYTFTVTNGADGEQGIQGPEGPQGNPGINGTDAREVEFRATETHIQWRFVGEGDWIDLVSLESLKGPAGKDGQDGVNGQNGTDGKDGVGITKTEITVDGELVITYTNGTSANVGKVVGADGQPGQNGQDGAAGADGTDGKSAYQIWLDAGNSGTEAEFLVALKGDQGEQGPAGADGLTTAVKVGDNTYEQADGVITLPDFLTEHQDLSSYALKSEIPDTSNLVSNDTLTAALAEKANDIPFTEDKIVGNAIGGFTVGDSVKGLTVVEILAKLLGLSDPATPGEPIITNEIVEAIVTNEYPVYTQDASGTLVENAYVYNYWTETAAAKPMNGVTTFYQIVADSGAVIESGYQCATVENEEDWVTVMLPSEITAFRIEQYNDDISDWQEVTFTMTGTASTTVSGYTVWRADDLYEVVAGATYRFVIIEEEV